jgi:hypothetical protein
MANFPPAQGKFHYEPSPALEGEKKAKMASDE